MPGPRVGNKVLMGEGRASLWRENVSSATWEWDLGPHSRWQPTSPESLAPSGPWRGQEHTQHGRGKATNLIHHLALIFSIAMMTPILNSAQTCILKMRTPRLREVK